MMALLEFYVSSFWVWAGTTVGLYVVCGGARGFVHGVILGLRR